jgi:hypothetical protein
MNKIKLFKNQTRRTGIGHLKGGDMFILVKADSTNPPPIKVY